MKEAGINKRELKKINEEFNRDLKKFDKGELKTNEILKLGKPLDILLRCGIPNNVI